MPNSIYQVKIKGYIDANWSDWFDGWSIEHEGEDSSVLTSPLVDQSALYGVLIKINDLNIQLISVQREEMIGIRY